MSKLRRLMNRLSHGALTSVAALALTAVSYTHLDVYKRQLLQKTINLMEI